MEELKEVVAEEIVKEEEPVEEATEEVKEAE